MSYRMTSHWLGAEFGEIMYSQERDGGHSDQAPAGNVVSTEETNLTTTTHITHNGRLTDVCSSSALLPPRLSYRFTWPLMDGKVSPYTRGHAVPLFCQLRVRGIPVLASIRQRTGKNL
jgi:hypothetical protein